MFNICKSLGNRWNNGPVNSTPICCHYSLNRDGLGQRGLVPVGSALLAALRTICCIPTNGHYLQLYLSKCPPRRGNQSNGSQNERNRLQRNENTHIEKEGSELLSNLLVAEKSEDQEVPPDVNHYLKRIFWHLDIKLQTINQQYPDSLKQTFVNHI